MYEHTCNFPVCVSSSTLKMKLIQYFNLRLDTVQYPALVALVEVARNLKVQGLKLLEEFSTAVNQSNLASNSSDSDLKIESGNDITENGEKKNREIVDLTDSDRVKQLKSMYNSWNLSTQSLPLNITEILFLIETDSLFQPKLKSGKHILWICFHVYFINILRSWIMNITNS